MFLLCIDPGTTHSGIVMFDNKKILHFWKNMQNETVLDTIIYHKNYHLVIEGISSYGMPIGKEVLDTCIWIGRFIQLSSNGYSLIYRKVIKLNLCGTSRAKDKNIRQAIIDRFEPIGGGSIPQIGTKKQPGPLYGMSSHTWPALAAGLTYLDYLKEDTKKNKLSI